MNFVFPSEDRVALTAKSLNFTLPMEESVRKLVKHREERQRNFVRGTKEDSQALLAHINQRLGRVTLASRRRTDFDRDYWYIDGFNESGRLWECSHFGEVGFDKVALWFVRNQKFLIRTEGKVTELDLYADSDDDSAEEREQEDPDSEQAFETDSDDDR